VSIEGIGVVAVEEDAGRSLARAAEVISERLLMELWDRRGSSGRSREQSLLGVIDALRVSAMVRPPWPYRV